MSEEGRKLTKHGRIKVAIKWLINSGVANNQELIGKMLGYENKSYFSQIVNGKVSLPSGFTYKLCELDKTRRLNETWVSEGWGQMIDETNYNKEDMNTKTYDDLLRENLELKDELDRYKSIIDTLTGHQNKRLSSQ